MPPLTATTNPSAHSLREHVYKHFTKDPKCKTAKCKLCDARITRYSIQCGHCKKRLCSECIEDEGLRHENNKAVAADHLENGCWCGFRSGIHPAFGGRLAKPAAVVPMAAKAEKGREKTSSGSEWAGRGKKKLMVREESQKAGEHVKASADAPVLTEVSIDQATAGPKRRRSSENHSESEDAPVQKKRKVRARRTAEQTPSYSTTQSSKQALKEMQEAQIQETIVVEPRIDQNQSLSKDKGKGKVQDEQTAVKQSIDTIPPKRGTKRTRGNAPDADVEEIRLEPPKKRRTSSSDSDTTKAASKKRNNSKTTIEAAPKKNTRSNTDLPVSDLKGKRTIIVGAGIIGLFTAYELAKKVRESRETSHQIMVVDVNEKECMLASGHCSGFITINGMADEESWARLLGPAISAWEDLRDDPSFARSVFCTTKNYTPADGAPVHDFPWFRPTTAAGASSLATDDNTLCRLSTPQLAAWLRRECERLGVAFHFNTHPSALARRRRDGPVELRLSHHATAARVPAHHHHHHHLEFSSLVLAAGPFTPDLFARLVPDPAVQLHGHARRGFWLRLPVAADVPASVGVSLPDDRAGGPRLVAHRKSASVTLAVVGRDRAPATTLRLRHAVETASRAGARRLRELASELVAVRGHAAPLAAGSMWVGTGREGAPLVREIPGLGGRVIVAYGFGWSGTTLAPGVAGEVVRMVCG